MKFDKETIIVVMVCIVLITLCNVFLSPKQVPQQPAKEQTVVQNTVKPADAKPVNAVPGNADTKKDNKPVAKSAAPAKSPQLNPAPVVVKDTVLENKYTAFYFNGKGIFGIGCGVLTILIRYFGGYNEGVSYAILIMNCVVVLLDRIGRPKKFGAPKKEAAKV